MIFIKMIFEFDYTCHFNNEELTSDSKYKKLIEK